MKRIIITALVVLVGLSNVPAAGEPDRVGVYDSRAIAIAWAGTEPFITEMVELKQRHKAAREAGDAELAEQLSRQGQAMQHRLHQQGFSTAPVDDILARFQSEITTAMEQAGVTVIISKWDEARLAQYPSEEQVDVTMALVDAMKTNEQQLAVLKHLETTPPVPLEEIKEHSH